MTMETQPPLELKIDLSALEHLGMNLYSNIPAVLSEIVANAWDADAKTVEITLDPAGDKITIKDDGVGMDRRAVIDRYLTVGFKRREDQSPEKTPLGRHPMGRKGIGKLSIFSIAKIAEVHTICSSQKTSFRIDREVMRQQIKEQSSQSYAPEEIDHLDRLESGTCIELSGLSKQIKGMVSKGLKRRIARRFSVISDKRNFQVSVNGDTITPEDREYHQFIEHLWTYGDQRDFVKLCENLQSSAHDRTSVITEQLARIAEAAQSARISLSGWIGTVSKPSDLKVEYGGRGGETDSDNLHQIAVFMRGKMAQEDILADFARKEIYADYLLGEIHCEELDANDNEDIATSSRQAFKSDDTRILMLREVILSELRNIANTWSSLRCKRGAKLAKSVPEVDKWMQSLQGDSKKKAEKWIGRLNTIRTDSNSDQKELLKASVLAFVSYHRKEELDRLDHIADEGLQEVLKVFRDIDDIEHCYYGQIVKGRLEIIKTLANKIDKDEKEKAIQQYIFNHLWLLDPSWERAVGTEISERTIGRIRDFLRSDTAGLSKKEKRARIDIFYQTMAGKHVIVELKRGSVLVSAFDLAKQIYKYKGGVLKILENNAHLPSEPIEVICLLGRYPKEMNDPHSESYTECQKILAAQGARVVLYDQLLRNAETVYGAYLNGQKGFSELGNIFQAIDDFSSESTEATSET